MVKGKGGLRSLQIGGGIVLLLVGLTILPINVVKGNYWAVGIAAAMILGGIWALGQAISD